MTLETKKERILYLGVVPVIGAVLGGLATAVFQIMSAPTGDLPTYIEVMRNDALSAEQKLELIKIIKEVSDRPWGIIRSLTTSLMVWGGFVIVVLVQRMNRT